MRLLAQNEFDEIFSSSISEWVICGQRKLSGTTAQTKTVTFLNYFFYLWLTFSRQIWINYEVKLRHKPQRSIYHISFRPFVSFRTCRVRARLCSLTVLDSAKISRTKQRTWNIYSNFFSAFQQKQAEGLPRHVINFQLNEQWKTFVVIVCVRMWGVRLWPWDPFRYSKNPVFFFINSSKYDVKCPEWEHKRLPIWMFYETQKLYFIELWIPDARACLCVFACVPFTNPIWMNSTNNIRMNAFVQ